MGGNWEARWVGTAGFDGRNRQAGGASTAPLPASVRNGCMGGLGWESGAPTQKIARCGVGMTPVDQTETGTLERISSRVVRPLSFAYQALKRG